ncbi:ricin-type beta-trefoil lectin domain protein [Streptomyces sp. NPDC047315]|uniref:ricin-type beta-trefoil lectin domain protein n=1 Tax=Streptomyces sp. NPDC047315 TaxID=3155142 RepID=UPI0033FD9D9F
MDARSQRSPRGRGRAGRPGRWAVSALALCALLSAACSAGTAPSPDAQREPPCRRTLVGVAHPDDDVFFLTPEIRRTVRAGCPVDTVYLTAGDGGITDPGRAREYADSREYGVRAAYAEMAETANEWQRADVQADGVRVRSYRLVDRDRDADVRLTFLDLHDGMPHGGHPNSLRRLYEGRQSAVTAFRGDASYTEDSLVATVSGLLKVSGAERILTMDHDHASFAFGLGGRVDHSDHGIGARYVRRAGYALGVPVTTYLGYTMSPLRANLTPGQVAEKDEVVRWYIAHRTCRPSGTCSNVPPYRGTLKEDWRLWVHRQYEQVHRPPRRGEVVADVGRTTYATGRDPAQCLHGDGGTAATAAVRLHGCDGSAAQQWEVRGDGTVRPRHRARACLTVSGPDAVRLEPCREGSPAQRWAREPWRSSTWSRRAWRLVGMGGRCLSQDDRKLPARWDSRDRTSPLLVFAACGTVPRPEDYWSWAG